MEILEEKMRKEKIIRNGFIGGLKKFAFNIWGDTENIALGLEPNSDVGKINISRAIYELVKDLPAVTLRPKQRQAGKFNCTHLGKVQMKDKGEIDTYFVE